MHKSTRLNDMILYLNDKTYFNLKDLIQKYDISKSTALRDIQALEEIGMPIYSEQGRNGRYGILKNRLISPILFTVDEIYALYFSFATLKNYESTPFQLNIEDLKQKFERCLSNELNERVNKMEEIFKFEGTKHHNVSPFLKELLQYALDDQVCTVIYNKDGVPQTIHAQFFELSTAYGQWYATGFNYESKKVQVFRCDRMMELSSCESYQANVMKEFLEGRANKFKSKDAIEFEVAIFGKGIDLFHKEHYPSMHLHQENDQSVIKGFYHQGEENFIARYFMNYGPWISSVVPNTLKQLIINQTNDVLQHFHSLK